LVIEGQYIRIILSPNLIGFSCILIYKYWISWNYVAMSQSVTFHCKILNIPWYSDSR